MPFATMSETDRKGCAPVSSCSVTIGLLDRPVKELRDDGREVERTVDNGDDR